MAVHFLLSEEDQDSIGRTSLDALSQCYTKLYPTETTTVEIGLIGIQEMQTLNHEARDIDEPTDVLSFPTYSERSALHEAATQHETLIGSVMICPEKATVYNESLIQLVHHGLLHLYGYDHETDFTSWAVEEGRILKELHSHSVNIPPVPHDSI